MSNSALKLLAASGAKGEATYVDDVFSTFLYTGTQATLAINNGIDFSGEGGLAWFKCRNVGMLHNLFDTVRGNTQRLDSSGTSEQSAQAAGKYPTFTSTGFTLGADDGGDINYSGREYASWSFRKAPGFFDIVTYTGNGTAGRTISHNLGSVPGMIIVKRTNAAEDWTCYHRATDSSSPQNYYLNLNTDHARDTLTGGWNNTAPTSAVFTVGDHNRVNGNGHTYVAYLFAHDAQDFGTDSDEAIIKCGSYTGNGSSTAGPTIDLGFEPQFIFQKAVDRAANWYMYDSMRGIASYVSDATITPGNDTALSPNTSSAEYVAERLALTASGFQITTDNGNFNQSGEKYIYMAIRRPHKPAEEFAATDLFAATLTSQDNNPVQTSLNATDLNIQKMRGDGTFWFVQSRLTGNVKYLRTNATNAEADYSASDPRGVFDTQGKVRSYSSDSAVTFSFMRAPGYFDVVAYTGTGSARTVTHNLGVAPEMMWVKKRNAAQNWAVYANNDPTNYLQLNTDQVSTDEDRFWNDTAPTSSVFTVGDRDEVNASSGTYISYLFASVAGISKVGSYTGTGNDINVDCGFSAGARFVMVKRTDSSGDWFVWDSVRGIVAGNDPYLLPNGATAEVTNTDYVDPLASGFTVTSSAPAALNNNGGTYIFYAIA